MAQIQQSYALLMVRLLASIFCHLEELDSLLLYQKVWLTAQVLRAKGLLTVIMSDFAAAIPSLGLGDGTSEGDGKGNFVGLHVGGGGVGLEVCAVGKSVAIVGLNVRSVGEAMAIVGLIVLCPDGRGDSSEVGSPVGAQVGSTGAGVGSTGVPVGSAGAGVGLTGADVGSTGAGVGSTGAGVGSTGAGVSFFDGLSEGSSVSAHVGRGVGFFDGLSDGSSVGAHVGNGVGRGVGLTVGCKAS